MKVSVVLCLILFVSLCSSLFPRPGLPDTTECSNCACTDDNWVCNVKTPSQPVGHRQVNVLETRTNGGWRIEPKPTVQKSNNFCEEGLLLNEISHFGTGNFFLPLEDLDLESGLDCYSIRLGDSTTRQKITFDLYPTLQNSPGPDFVIFEKGNGSRDGQFSDPNFEDSFLPEAFATSFKVDGHWTPYFYFSVREYLTTLGGATIPDWKHPDITYNAFFDAWSTVIEFEDYGIQDGQEVQGISLVNLLREDFIRNSEGHEGTKGEVLFSEHKDQCDLGNCVSPVISGTQRVFQDDEFDPDIAWLGPWRGFYKHK